MIRLSIGLKLGAMGIGPPLFPSVPGEITADTASPKALNPRKVQSRKPQKLQLQLQLHPWIVRDPTAALSRRFSMAFSSAFDPSIFLSKSSSQISASNAPTNLKPQLLVFKLHHRSFTSSSSSSSCSSKPLQSPTSAPVDVITGGGGDGKFPPGNGGDGGGGGDEGGEGGGDYEEIEFGPLMRLDEVIRETQARGIELPTDMLEAAKKEGIRKLLLFRYFDLQVIFFFFLVGKGDMLCASYKHIINYFYNSDISSM